MDNIVKGKAGENIAVAYLKNLGYQILETNFTTKLGEIDIVAKDKTYMVFVEVKARATKKFGLPSESINLHKQRKIRQVATQYQLKHKLQNTLMRIDVIEVLDNEVRHIINAF